MLTSSIRRFRRLAMPAVALTLACSDDPQIVSIVETTTAVCVSDTLRVPPHSGGCADLEHYFHATGVLNTDGVAYGVGASGTHAFVCDGRAGLAVVDIRDPSFPELASVVAMPGEPRDVATCGDIAFVASASGGLVIVDARHAQSAGILSQIHTPGAALGVKYRDGNVYLADDAIGLMIFDVADPMRPRPLGVENTPGQALDVSIDGALAYVADNQLGLRIVSIGDPDNPWLIASYAFANRPTAVDVAAGVAYLAAGAQGLVVADVSRPDSACVLTTYDTPGVVLDVAVADGIAYLADGSNGVVVLDVTTPEAPVQLARSGAETVARGIFTMDTWVLSADSDGGLRLFDATSVLAVPVASDFGVGGPRVEVIGAAADRIAYSTTRDGRVSVVSPGAGGRLTEQGFVAIGGLPSDAAYYEGRLYVANGAGISVIDPATPGQPAVVSTIPAIGAKRFAICDSTFFITRGFSAAAAIYDLRTQQSTGLTISAGSVAAGPQNGYFAELNGRVWITIGKVGSTHPIRNLIDGYGSTRDLEVHGDRLFVTKHQGGTDPETGIMRSAGIEVFDLTLFPEDPSLVTFIESSIAIERVAFDGDRMYLVGMEQGLEVIDVSDITAPRIVGTFSSDGDLYDVAPFDGVIYVAAGSGGLVLLGAECP